MPCGRPVNQSTCQPVNLSNCQSSVSGTDGPNGSQTSRPADQTVRDGIGRSSDSLVARVPGVALNFGTAGGGGLRLKLCDLPMTLRPAMDGVCPAVAVQNFKLQLSSIHPSIHPFIPCLQMSRVVINFGLSSG